MHMSDVRRWSECAAIVATVPNGDAKLVSALAGVAGIAPTAISAAAALPRRHEAFREVNVGIPSV
jgi:hypothetical protein